MTITEALQYYPWLFVILATVLGLLIGSFLNVVIYRLPRMMEIEYQNDVVENFPDANIEPIKEKLTLSVPRSTCPNCSNPVRAIDNIPVISWLLLKGKCFYCDMKISPRYPAVESLTAILTGIVAWQFGFSYFTVALLFFTFALIALTFIDLDTMLLPDQITLPLTWAGILLALMEISPVSLEDAVIGAMAGYLALWSVYHGFRLLTGKEGMGYGDFKLLAALGAWLGWQYLPMIILLSSFVGLFFGLVQLRMQKKGIDMQFPFGPYLAIAGWIALVAGEQIMQWYFTNFMGIPA